MYCIQREKGGKDLNYFTNIVKFRLENGTYLYSFIVLLNPLKNFCFIGPSPDCLTFLILLILLSRLKFYISLLVLSILFEVRLFCDIRFWLPPMPNQLRISWVELYPLPHQAKKCQLKIVCDLSYCFCLKFLDRVCTKINIVRTLPLEKEIRQV